MQGSLLPWPALPPLPANVFFNLSGAVPASCWGPHLDYGGSWLQGACPWPDSKGDDPHVWRPHEQGETHCHSTHVAQHILECRWGWAYPVRAWSIDGACTSHCMLALPSCLPIPLPSTGLTPSFQQSSSLISLPRAVVCGQAHLGTFASPTLTFPTLFPFLYCLQACRPPTTSDAVCLLWAFTLLFPLPGFLCTQLFPCMTLSYPKVICLRIAFSEEPSLTILK